MPDRLRVFVSSPGDVPDERLRADLIVDRLAQEYARFFTLETYRWEHEPMLASGHFQDAIAPPSEADIVILILWSRLGTDLPARTERREYRGLDGRAPVTGTEWEYEEALQAARERGAPDILAFRNVSPAAIETRDAAARAKSIAQFDALDAFWRRHFADRGVFLAAYDEYRSLEEFARRLEESLRKLIERRIASLGAAPGSGPPIWPGAPFRGLEPYEFAHAKIYFGRDRLVAKAAEQLAAEARAGVAFLLVSGPSGSGKSSLVKAALAPLLMKPQRILGAAFLRRATFRPGDGGADVVLGLVEALVRRGQEGVGLPELLAPGQDPAQLAAHLRAAAENPGFVFAGALARVTQQARAQGRLLGYEEGRLLLVIDQIEELLTAPLIPVEDRRLFIRLIGALARSGVVWVVATLRADFWRHAAEIPEFVALAEGRRRLDVAPAAPAELSDMIRKPAQAAGIAFEVNRESGLGLDAVIAEHAASEPGVLPLLSFTLDALYAQDVLEAGGRTLTFATYESLGGLEGAIARRADDVVAALAQAAQAAVPRVLRALATISGEADQAVTARVAPLAEFPDGDPARRVVDAFVAARLLVASSESGSPIVRLAHEALIGNWRRAREQLLADRRDLQTRALIERQRARWSAAAGRGRQQLLLRDPDLANAIDLARRWGDELDAAPRAFIRASQRRARLRQQLTAAAAIVFAVVAAAAVYGQYRARQESARAERNYAGAKQAVNHLILDVALGMRDVQGVRVEALAQILDAAKKTIGDLAATNPDDLDLQLSSAFMLKDFADTYRRAGDPQRARGAADAALAIFRKIAAADDAVAIFQRVTNDPSSRQLPQFMVSDALNRIGDLRHSAGDRTGALAAYEESLAIRRKLAGAFPPDPQMQGSVSATLNLIGNLRAEQSDRAGALAAFQEGLGLYRKLAAAEPQNPLWRSFEAVNLKRIGDLQFATVQRAAALPAYEESLAIAQKLADADPANVDYQEEIGEVLGQIGAIRAATGDREGATEAFQKRLDIRRALAIADPGDRLRQSKLGEALHAFGDFRAAGGDQAGAADAYREALATRRRLVALDADNPQRRFDLSANLNQLGNTLVAQGKRDEALADYQEGLDILQKLLAVEPNNGLWLRASGVRLTGIGNIKFASDDRDGARAAWAQSAAFGRKAVAAAPNMLLWKLDLAQALQKLSSVSDDESARAQLAEALALLEPLDHDSKLNPAQSGWVKSIRDKLASLK